MEAARIQHLSKASSDQLLRKFAELESSDDASTRMAIRAVKRPRKCRKNADGERYDGDGTGNDLSGSGSARLVERKSLLPRASRKSGLFRQVQVGKSKPRARDFKNKSVVGTVEKTWRKAVRGASRIFMERHYNRHRRLINDALAA
ncbi:hypothetical protein Ancab_030934 [Ancistrocladus abbreviatus]